MQMMPYPILFAQRRNGNNKILGGWFAQGDRPPTAYQPINTIQPGQINYDDKRKAIRLRERIELDKQVRQTVLAPAAAHNHGIKVDQILDPRMSG